MANRSCSSRVSSSRSISTTPTASRPSAVIRWRTVGQRRCDADRTHRDRGLLCRRRCGHRPARQSRSRSERGCERSVRAFLPDGCRLQFALPAGRHRYRRDPVPCDAAADHEAHAKPRLPIRTVYGARNEADLLYGEEFAAFAEATPGFGFHPCFSREPRAVPRAGDRNGRVQVALEALKPDVRPPTSSICAAIPTWSTRAFALLKDAGLPVPHVRREKYISSR